MVTYCYGVWNEFVNFIGGRAGLAHWVLYLLALLCCIFQGKELRKKLFFPSALVLLFFFNPLFYGYLLGRNTKFVSMVSSVMVSNGSKSVFRITYIKYP